MILPYGKTRTLPYGKALSLTTWLTLRTNERTNEDPPGLERGSYVSHCARTRPESAWIGAESWPLIIVTGSREWPEPTAVWRELFAVANVHGGLRVAVGDCRSGVDAHTRSWCRANTHQCRWVEYRAQWWRFGRAAGPIRNLRMVAENPDAHECVAFPMPGSVGTRRCMEAAERAGIPVREIPP
jgi:hypothetical protein